VTEHVDPAINLIEERFRAYEGGPVGLAYLRSHAFFNQLAPADECLSSFLGYELDPGSRRAVGGEGRPLGGLVGPHDEVAEPLREAVATTITASYLTMLSTEDPPGSDWVPGRDAESLWSFWVDHLSPAAILAFRIPDRFVASVARDGGKYLEDEVARLGLRPGFLQRRAVAQRCAEIGRFGLLLRVGQTSACSDSEFARALAV
jgi:hypothetical protein